jgi:hypothetical protein
MGLSREAVQRVRAPAWGVALVLSLVGVARLDAQAVRGQLVDSRSGAPISGAFVVLLDQTGREIARGLTGDSGTFLLRAPDAGAYRLQSKRIGFRLSETPPFLLALDQTIAYQLKVEAVRTLLPLVVEGRPQCGSRGDEASAVARLWEEIQEALRAVRWTEREGAHYYAIQLYDRELSADAQEVLSERGSARSGYSVAPFASVPADQLWEGGYIVPGSRDTLIFYAPDADVLLGDMFTSTHCFMARSGGVQRPGLVGLGFEPVPNRKVSDVRGVLWLEAGTLRLRVLEFTYTRPPDPLPLNGLSGHVEFMPLPTGPWIVSRWWIRMARAARVVMQFPDALPVLESRVLGFRENGGQVVTITSARGSVLYAADRAILAGTVLDSSRAGAPLGRALVALRGTGREVRADTRGRFELSAPFDGTYAVALAHPRLDSLGIELAPVVVTLARGSRTVVTLAVPPEERIVASLCPGRLRPGVRVIVGTARGPGGDTVPGAGVRLAWLAIGAEATQLGDAGLEAVTDSVGRYVLCGVPTGSFRILATADAGGSDSVVLEFSEGGVWIDQKQYHGLRGRIWTQDLHLLP